MGPNQPNTQPDQQGQPAQQFQPPDQQGQGYAVAPQQAAGQVPPTAGQQPAPTAPQAPPAGNQQYAPPAQPAPQAPPTGGQPAPQAGTEQMGQTPANPNSTQNALQIAEIRDGIVIMNDGSYRAVIMTKSINFDLMNPKEREGVEMGFQGFLNSLYFPIQICIRSQRIDMRPYLQKLVNLQNQQENYLLGMLMEDYINYISQLTTQTNIMDKSFYIVVPYFTEASAEQAVKGTKKFLSGLLNRERNKQVINIDEAELEKAKNELKNRVQSVIGGLFQIGLQSIPLATQELIELYYDVYNPDTATRQKLASFGNLDAAVVSKGQGQAPTPNLDNEVA